MFEEVCLLCSRPVLADGRAYCSDACESLDITSPSISTTSSAQPSPFLHSTANPPAHLTDIPALLPSALGHSPNARKSHRVRHSESSSSTSSVSWSAFDDESCVDEPLPSVNHHGANVDNELYALNPDYLAAEAAFKPSLSFSNVHRHPGSSLAYVRRPSGTNNRSTVPTLHHRASSASTPSTASTGMSRSMPYDCSTEDDVSDVPSVPTSPSSARSDRRKGRQSAGSVPQVDAEADREKEPDTVGKTRRNRASLPAYFSLLVSTSTTPRTHKNGSALFMLSQSLQNSASPPTPRLAMPIVDTTMAFAHPPCASNERLQPADVIPRGRGRRHDPVRRSSPHSPDRSPRPRAHGHSSAQARARLDSMEKVAEWVARSPVVATGTGALRHTVQRRNSSPLSPPKFEKMYLRDSGVEDNSSFVNTADEVFEEEYEVLAKGRRGRLRVNELDHVIDRIECGAPGYGIGRSGILARDRERGRAPTVKR